MNMKKILVLGIMAVVVLSSISANGMYGDAGISLGGATHDFNGADFADQTAQDANPTGFALSFGGKLGFGHHYRNNRAVYLVADLATIHHQVFDDYQFHSNLLGGGLVWYPSKYVQIAGNYFGYVWADHQVSSHGTTAIGSGGSGFNLSIGLEVSGCMLGLEYYNATVEPFSSITGQNTSYFVNSEQNTSYFGVLFKYVFRYHW
jgi:hypothetical protein